MLRWNLLAWLGAASLAGLVAPAGAEESLLTEVRDLEKQVYAVRLSDDARAAKLDEFERACVALIEKHGAVEDKALIFAEITRTYSQTGMLKPDKIVEYAKKTLELSAKPVDRLEAYGRWGDALIFQIRGKDFAAGRKEAAMPFLMGLKETLKCNLPDKAPEMPRGDGLMTWAFADTPEDRKIQEELKRRREEYEKARESVEFQRDMIRWRDALLGQAVGLYTRPPFATDELRRLATEVIGNPDMVNALVGRVEAKVSAIETAARIANDGPARKAKIAELAEALKAPDAEARQAAAKALGDFGPPKAKEAVPALDGALGDADRRVRLAAARALGQIGPDAKDAVPELIKTLGDEFGDVRFYSALAFLRIGKGAREAVPALAKAVGDTQADVREYSALALGQIGPSAKEAVPALMKALDDPEADVRGAAIAGLGGIGPASEAAVPGIIKALEDADAGVRQNASCMLTQIAPGREDVLRALVKVLGDPAGPVRSNAAWSMSRAGRKAVPLLITALGNPGVTARQGAANALGRIGPEAEDAIPELERLSEKDPDQNVRHDARDALAKIRK